MATDSSILAWRIPRTEEPGWLQSMGRRESDVTDLFNAHTHTRAHTHTPTPPHPHQRVIAGYLRNARLTHSLRSESVMTCTVPTNVDYGHRFSPHLY